MKHNFDLSGKIALVSGASRGIGECIAETLAAHGAICILASRKIDALREVEQKITAAGGKAHCIACNLGDLKQVDAMMAEIKDKYGKLDILVNNAATNPYFGDMAGIDEDSYNKTNDVNLKGPFFTIKHAVPLMEKAGGGSIINVSSINGIRPPEKQGVYSMTKAAMISMTKGFAKELAPKKIRVNALLPGLTATKFSSVMTNDHDFMENELLPLIPLHRAAQPEEMTGAVLYLASDSSSFMTGALMVVDGGQLA